VRVKDDTLSAGRKVPIDGQQRVTALSAAMAGRKVVNQDYQQMRIRIAFNPMRETFEVLNTAIRSLIIICSLRRQFRSEDAAAS
jgi:hypothetical protein